MAETKRERALRIIRAAGAENNQPLFVRTYTEGRVSYAAAIAAFCEGKRFGDSVRARDTTLTHGEDLKGGDNHE